MTEEIQLARMGFLTRRVRYAMRAFAKNPQYTHDTLPRIQWDEQFAPPEEYPQVRQDTMRSEGKDNGKGKGWAVDREDNGKGKGQMVDREDNGKGKGQMVDREDNGKGKGRAVDGEEDRDSWTGGRFVRPGGTPAKRVRMGMQSEESRGQTAPKKRRIIKSRATIEDSDESNEQMASAPMTRRPRGDEAGSLLPASALMANSDEPTAMATRATPRAKAGGKPRKDDTDSSALIPAGTKAKQPRKAQRGSKIPQSAPPPPDCTRCIVNQRRCVNNGWRKACQGCRNSRQMCSLAKAAPPTTPTIPTTAPTVPPTAPTIPPTAPTVPPTAPIAPTVPPTQPEASTSTAPVVLIPRRLAANPRESTARGDKKIQKSAPMRVSPAMAGEVRGAYLFSVHFYLLT
jgi:hypothetical protein